MSSNNKMHPRNVFRTPPDYRKLSLKYSELRPFVKLNAAGRGQLDFHNAEAVRALSKVLMMEYFKINLSIPEHCLTPTIPLRLNYVLWLEDLAEFLNKDKTDISVIDIGAGATCVYGLLMAKIKSWNVLALEVDPQNYKWALENVTQNNLNEKISVVLQNSENLLIDHLDRSSKYTFCMCNPPFFDEASEDDKPVKKTPPRNAFTGSDKELKCPGGEVAFIKKLIKESEELKEIVLVYTTMVGHKKHLGVLKQALKEANIASFSQTEFHQGVTTRWALAWTYTSEFNLQQFPTFDDVKKPQHQKFTHLTSKYNSLSEAETAIKTIFNELKLTYDLAYKNEHFIDFKIKAYEETWTNSRKKRREAARLAKIATENSREDENEEIDSKNKKRKLNEDDSNHEAKMPRLESTSNDTITSTTFRPKPLIEFSILISREDEQIKILLVKVGRDNPNMLCQIFNYIVNFLKK